MHKNKAKVSNKVKENVMVTHARITFAG